MQVSQSNKHLGGDELSLLLGEPLFVADMVIQVATLNKVQEEVNSEFVLEHVAHVQNKWVLSLKQYVFLFRLFG